MADLIAVLERKLKKAQEEAQQQEQIIAAFEKRVDLLERVLEEITRVVEEEVPECGCTEGSHIYGCHHTGRRLREMLGIPPILTRSGELHPGISEEAKLWAQEQLAKRLATVMERKIAAKE